MARSTNRIRPALIAPLLAYEQRLIAAGIPLTDVLLFGSQAKGTARDDSDIDVAVVSPSFGADYFEERVQLMRLREGVSYVIEPHPFHPRDLADRWDTLAQEVREHGISLRTLAG